MRERAVTPRVVLVLSALIVIWCAGASASAQAQPATYGVVIGNNRPLLSAPEMAALRYADDDAVRYYELLRRASREAVLLTVLDHESQRRYPALAAQAAEPTLARLRAAIARIASHTRDDLERGQRPVVFLTFSGHGGTLPTGESYLALADGPLTRAQLVRDVIEALPDVDLHLIVDACNAAAVVGVRGPFGRELEAQTVELDAAERRALLERDGLRSYPRVGALVASAADQEAHEWSRIQGGVFTHVVLSALLGAADINADRRIEYSEVQAFVASAHRDLADPRARPQLIAHAPSGNTRAVLISLPDLQDTTLLIGRARHLGRFYVELDDGTRWLEAHVSDALELALAVPARRTLHLRTADREAMARGRAGETIELTAMPLRPRTLHERGSLADALQRGLFGSVYGRAYYLGYIDSLDLPGVAWTGAVADDGARHVDGAGAVQRNWATAALIAGGGALIGSAIATGLALDAHADFEATDKQREAADAKSRFEDARAAAIVLAGVSAALAGAGTVLWMTADVSPEHAAIELQLRARF